MPGHGSSAAREYVEGRPPSPQEPRERSPWYLHALAVLAASGASLGGWSVTRAPAEAEVARPLNATAERAEELDREVRRLRRLVYRLQDSALVRRDTAEWEARERRRAEGRAQGPDRPVDLPRL